MILGRGLVVLLCVSCAFVVSVIAFFSHASAGKHLRVAIFDPESLRTPQNVESDSTKEQSTSSPLWSGSQNPHFSIGPGNRTWWFDLARDGLNYGLSDAQCDAAFPGYFEEVYRTAAQWKAQREITVDDVDISWRGGREMVRAMIVDRQVSALCLLFLSSYIDNLKSFTSLKRIGKQRDETSLVLSQYFSPSNELSMLTRVHCLTSNFQSA